MKIKVTAVLFFLALAGASAAQSATVPSEASIDKLLAVTNARSLVDNVAAQMDGVMKNTAQQMLQGKTLTPEQQKTMDDMLTKMAATYKEELDWAHMRPMYLRLYQGTFNQEEVDGMVAFYNSPVGQSMTKKMPLLMQNMMGEIQKMVVPMVQKFQASARDAAATAQQQQSNKPAAQPKK